MLYPGLGSLERLMTRAKRSKQLPMAISVFLLGVGNDLGVAPAHVEDSGILGPRDQASHLYVSNTMIHTYNRLIPQLSNSSGNHSHTSKRSPHSRALCVSNCI